MRELFSSVNKSFAKLHVYGCLEKTHSEQSISTGRGRCGSINDKVLRLVSGGRREVQVDFSFVYEHDSWGPGYSYLLVGECFKNKVSFLETKAHMFCSDSPGAWHLKESELGSWAVGAIWTWRGARWGLQEWALCSGLAESWRAEPGSTAFSHRHTHLAPMLKCLLCCSWSPPPGPLRLVCCSLFLSRILSIEVPSSLGMVWLRLACEAEFMGTVPRMLLKSQNHAKKDLVPR